MERCYDIAKRLVFFERDPFHPLSTGSSDSPDPCDATTTGDRDQELILPPSELENVCLLTGVVSPGGSVCTVRWSNVPCAGLCGKLLTRRFLRDRRNDIKAKNVFVEKMTAKQRDRPHLSGGSPTEPAGAPDSAPTESTESTGGRHEQRSSVELPLSNSALTPQRCQEWSDATSDTDSVVLFCFCVCVFFF